MQIKTLRDIYRIRMINNQPVLLESLEKYSDELQPHINELTRSGRYDVVHIAPSSYDDGHIVHYNAKRPYTAVEFQSKPQRPGVASWYDPTICELESSNTGEPFERLHPRLKSHSGYTPSIQHSNDSNTIYR